jgi:hypothetical protein
MNVFLVVFQLPLFNLIGGTHMVCSHNPFTYGYDVPPYLRNFRPSGSHSSLHVMKDCLPLALLLTLVFGFAALASAQTMVVQYSTANTTTTLIRTTNAMPALPTGSTHVAQAPTARIQEFIGGFGGPQTVTLSLDEYKSRQDSVQRIIDNNQCATLRKLGASCF